MERIDVVQIQSTSRAFAAIRRDGHVVSWGDPARGGDSRAVQDQRAVMCLTEGPPLMVI